MCSFRRLCIGRTTIPTSTPSSSTSASAILAPPPPPKSFRPHARHPPIITTSPRLRKAATYTSPYTALYTALFAGAARTKYTRRIQMAWAFSFVVLMSCLVDWDMPFIIGRPTPMGRSSYLASPLGENGNRRRRHHREELVGGAPEEMENLRNDCGLSHWKQRRREKEERARMRLESHECLHGHGGKMTPHELSVLHTSPYHSHSFPRWTPWKRARAHRDDEPAPNNGACGRRER